MKTRDIAFNIPFNITAKNILIRQAEWDAGEARHLQETQATIRATGIAAHYATKEETPSALISEEDQQFIPHRKGSGLNLWDDVNSYHPPPATILTLKYEMEEHKT